MTTCLVLGANGQDGSYLSEILTSTDVQVYGVGRAVTPRYPTENSKMIYVSGDLRDFDWLRDFINRLEPDEIYHLAAVHGPSGFDYEAVWADAVDVNVKVLYYCLEYARSTAGRARVFYPSSAKVFGSPLPARVSLNTPRQATCLYSNNKLSAENLLKHYRDKHKVHAVLAYLYNHESPRRGTAYFIPQVMRILYQALSDRSYRDELFTLDFYCDWGCAREYMGMAIDHLRIANPIDLIFATGTTHYARDFVAKLFDRYGLDYRNHIKESSPDTDATKSVVDIADTRAALGRHSQRTIFDVCADIIASLEQGAR